MVWRSHRHECRAEKKGNGKSEARVYVSSYVFHIGGVRTNVATGSRLMPLK
jgi:hypothetical protein